MENKILTKEYVLKNGIDFDDDILVNDEFMFFDNNFDLSLFQKVVINND